MVKILDHLQDVAIDDAKNPYRRSKVKRHASRSWTHKGDGAGAAAPNSDLNVLFQ